MPVLIPTARLHAICDPFANPWGGRRFTVAEVRAAIKQGRFQKKPWGAYAETGARYSHVARIAWLAVSGWHDAVEVDVGVPSLRCFVKWPVQDGNHRLAAAIVRGDENILASVAGCMDTAFELFGVDCCEEPAESAPDNGKCPAP